MNTFTITIPGLSQPIMLSGEGLSMSNEQQYWNIWRSTGENAEANPPEFIGSLTLPDGSVVTGGLE